MSVVIVTALATLSIQLGLFLWKLSAASQPRIGEAKVFLVLKSLLTDWRWVLGTCATTLGWILFVYATSLGDISLIQPLMSAGDFILIMLAVVFLKERLSAMEWVGVLVTIAGAVALAWGAKSSDTVAFDRVAFWSILAVSTGLAVVLYLANRKSPRAEVLLSPIVGLSFGMGAVLTKAMTANRVQSGDSVLGISLLVDPFLIGVVVANVIGLILLQAAFQRGRASVIVPVQLAMANIVTVAAGIMVFSEAVSFSRWVGILLIVMGTALLHIKTRNQTTPSAGS